MKKTLWSPEEEDILEKLAKRGFSSSEIAVVLKSRTITGIDNKAHRMKLPLGSGEPEIDQTAFQQLMKRRK
jgi:hypothetical protein